jgi:hypothetical protein
MPTRKSGPRHLKQGRPGYADLQLFLEVEAGRRRLAMSVNAFCRNRSVHILRAGRPCGGSKVGVMGTVTGETLRRRYQSVRVRFCPLETSPGRKAKVRPIPAYLEELIQRHLSAGGGLFPHK